MVDSPKDCKPPRDFGRALKKAREVMDGVPDLEAPFYDEKWFELIKTYPKLCSKIEQLRMDVPSVAEYNALKKQVEEQGLILQELWEHRVRGKPQ